MHSRISKGFRSSTLGTGEDVSVTSICLKYGEKKRLITYLFHSFKPLK